MHGKHLCAKRALHGGADVYTISEHANNCFSVVVRTLLTGNVYLSEDTINELLEHRVGNEQ